EAGAGNLRRGKAVDVEGATLNGSTRDQRTACSQRSENTFDHDIGRHHSFVLHSRVSYQGGCIARTLHRSMVRSHEDRNVSSVLRGILRYESLGNDWFGDRDGAKG